MGMKPVGQNDNIVVMKLVEFVGVFTSKGK